MLKEVSNEHLSILVLRIVMASMWIGEGLIKLLDRTPSDPINDHHFFLKQLQTMASSHPDAFISSLITNILVQNYSIFVWIIIVTELTVGLTVLLGFFSRIGSFIGMNMTIVLWILTLGWGEWIFTYPLIFAPMLAIFISNSSKEIGFDKYLKPKVSNKYLNYLI